MTRRPPCAIFQWHGRPPTTFRQTHSPQDRIEPNRLATSLFLPATNIPHVHPKRHSFSLSFDFSKHFKKAWGDEVQSKLVTPRLILSLVTACQCIASAFGGTSIFGGMGGYTGTILGALILSVLNSILTFLNVGQAIRQVVYGLIVLALA